MPEYVLTYQGSKYRVKSDHDLSDEDIRRAVGAYDQKNPTIATRASGVVGSLHASTPSGGITEGRRAAIRQYLLVDKPKADDEKKRILADTKRDNRLLREGDYVAEREGHKQIAEAASHLGGQDIGSRTAQAFGALALGVGDPAQTIRQGQGSRAHNTVAGILGEQVPAQALNALAFAPGGALASGFDLAKYVGGTVAQNAVFGQPDDIAGAAMGLGLVKGIGKAAPAVSKYVRGKRTVTAAEAIAGRDARLGLQSHVAEQGAPFAERPLGAEFRPKAEKPQAKEAALPTEPPKKFAASNAAVDDLLERIGVEPRDVSKPERTKYKQALESFDPDAHYERLRKAAEQGRAGEKVSDSFDQADNLKTAALGKQIEDKVNSLRKSINDKIAKGQDAVAESDALNAQLERAATLHEGNRYVGTKQAQALASRNLAAFEDMSEAGLYADSVAANGGKKLSSELAEQVKELARKNAENEARIAKLEQAATAREAQNALKGMATRRPRTLDKASIYERRSAAVERIKAKMSGAAIPTQSEMLGLGSVAKFAGRLADIAPDVMELVRTYADAGIYNIKELTAAVQDTLRKGGTHLDESDIHKIIAGQFEKVPKTKTEAQVWLSDLQKQARNTPAAQRAALEARTAKLKGQIETGEFPSRPVRNAWDRSVQDALVEKEATRIEAEELKANLRRKSDRDAMGRGEKALDNLRQLAGVPTSLNASTDLSFFLNQGIVPLLTHPITAIRALAKGGKAALSEKALRVIEAEIRSSPKYNLARSSRLAIGQDAGTSDFFISRLVDKAPLIAQSQRAYVANGKLARMKMFEQLVDAYEKPLLGIGERKAIDTETAKKIADYVNVMSGQGVGPTAQALKALNAKVPGGLLFGPSYLVSRWQLYTKGIGLIPMIAKNPKFAAVMLKDYAKVAGAIYGLTQLAGGETDPRSSNFGKVRVGGDVWVDPFAGVLTPIRLLAQMSEGRKGKDGKVRTGYGAESMDVLTQYLGGKSSPLVRMGSQVLDGENKYTGQKVGFKSLDELKGLASSLLPISVQSIAEVWNAKGLTEQQKYALTIAQIFGANVNDQAKPAKK